jgi:hypothetical protein
MQALYRDESVSGQHSETAGLSATWLREPMAKFHDWTRLANA